MITSLKTEKFFIISPFKF